MIPTLYTVQRAGPGRLSVMARPRGGDWLEDELRALGLAGVQAVVCALTPDEQDELNLADEQRVAEAAGLSFLPAPIPDRTVPEFDAVAGVVEEAARIVDEGGHVAVHCRAGIGRSSLLVAAVLVTEGFSAQEAWERIEKARGLPVPDTEEQREWIERLAAHSSR